MKYTLMNTNHLISVCLLLLMSFLCSAPLASNTLSRLASSVEQNNPDIFNNSLAIAEQRIYEGDLLSAQQQVISSYPLAKNDFQRAQIFLLSSQVYFLQGELIEAKKLLDQIIELNEPILSAQANIQIARIWQIQQQDEKALIIYQQLKEHLHPEISAIAKINLFDLNTQLDNKLDNEQQNRLLSSAYQKINDLKDSRQLALLVFFIQKTIDKQPEMAWKALKKLTAYPQIEKHPRYYSQLYAYQSYLYAQQGKTEDALNLIQRAIFIAQLYPDLLMQWEWQQGKILSAIDQSAAVAAYRRAESHLQKIRSNIPVRYIDGRSSYREMLAPLYMQYTQLLLNLAKKEKFQHHNIKQQQLLRQAQQVIESLKLAELRDYFKNACAIEQYPLIDLTRKFPKTAFIYPIIFDQSLDILLGVNNQLHHYSIKVNKSHLQQTIRRAMLRLRPTASGYLRPFAKREIAQLYRWLIKPLEKQLNQNQIDTLVFVPDGMLRMIPVSVLWDGKQYLIEKFAIATMPGATLIDPSPLARSNIQGDNILIAGLSKPGNVVKELPIPMQLSLVDQDSLAEEQRGIAFNQLSEQSQPLLLKPYQIDKIKSSLELPGVEKEISSLEKIANTRAILNKDFQLDIFKQKTKAASIVHIASHGMFTGDPQSSFIMAHDHLLDMNILADLFKTGAYTDKPVDLLVLSACQTAEGDDRSPLGLAGVALQSGARSILGSLWPISDSTATIIFPTFYQKLRANKLLSKAKALQQAQIKLIHTKGMSHPFYWAPFVLIGNWF